MSIRSLSTSTLTEQTRYSRMSGVFGSPPYTCEYVVVAGGGGGGDLTGASNFGCGGGGAGGFRNSFGSETSGRNSSTETPLQLSAGTYTLTVGGGGAIATKGDSSVFGGIVSDGGGFGRSTNNGPGGPGGSGGGGANDSGGSGTAGQGFDGGDSTHGTGRGSGGGGGAGQAGETVNDSFDGGDGGNGLSTSITGSSIAMAGGGGGGAAGNVSGGGGGAVGSGGTGGGGNGARYDIASTSGATNTGGGGGAGAGVNFGVTGFQNGSPGGSGRVIFKLPKQATVTFDASHSVTTHSAGTHTVYEVTAGDGDITIA